jgi:hypothetical protein
MRSVSEDKQAWSGWSSAAHGQGSNLSKPGASKSASAKQRPVQVCRGYAEKSLRLCEMEVPEVLGVSSRRPTVGVQTSSAFPKFWKALHADRTRKNQISVWLTVRPGNHLAIAILVRLVISPPKKTNPRSHYGRLLPDGEKGNNFLGIDILLMLETGMLETLFWLYSMGIEGVFLGSIDGALDGP